MDALDRLNGDMLPFARLIGMTFVEAAPERVVGALTIRDELCTRPAVAHGGVLMSFADTLGAAATILNLPDGAATTTIESKTNFLAAAPLGARILGEAGRLVASVVQTQLVLPKRG